MVTAALAARRWRLIPGLVRVGGDHRRVQRRHRQRRPDHLRHAVRRDARLPRRFQLQRRRRTRLKSFDGTPLALYVTLPPAPSSGTDGNYPAVVQSHGWGADDRSHRHAVLRPHGRFLGPGRLCGAAAGRSRLWRLLRELGVARGRSTGCQNGYIRLDDDRYEARDVQYALGLLVDEGVVDPHRIGVTGESYGGGVSLELATLNDRVMNANGSLSPWTSPNGTPLSIAAAAPVIPWSDLVYSLVPNGRTRDDQITSPHRRPVTDRRREAVLRLGAVPAGPRERLLLAADDQPAGRPDDLVLVLNAGEPYDGNTEDQAIATQIAHYHSPYYLLDGAYGTAAKPPPPLLIANGFTDDLFPVDEARALLQPRALAVPERPDRLFDFDGGHMRGQNKPAELACSPAASRLLRSLRQGRRPPPQLGATALTQTCPTERTAGRPVQRADLGGPAPRRGRLQLPAGPDDHLGRRQPGDLRGDRPDRRQGACATVPATDQGAGVATLPPAGRHRKGLHAARSAEVSADLTSPARTRSSPSACGTSTRARTPRRSSPAVSTGSTRRRRRSFQLHPGAWHFAAGHIPKLELLSQDSPYVRTSNGQFSISVSDLRLRPPVHEVPGAPGTPRRSHKRRREHLGHVAAWRGRVADRQARTCASPATG